MSGKHSHSAGSKGDFAVRRIIALAALLAGAAGIISYYVSPRMAATPTAGQLHPGVFAAPNLASLLGQGTAVSFAPNPVPIVSATAKAARAKATRAKATGVRTATGRPEHTAKPTVSATTPAPTAISAATRGALFAGAAGIGLYDGTFSPRGIETAARWLGASRSIKYAEDFIDATDWSHISDPWQLSRWTGSPFTMVWGVPMLPCGTPATQCATNVPDYNRVANGGADRYYKALARHLVSAGFGASYIRLGWEFNASWMAWGICDSSGTGLQAWASDFVPAFRNIVTSMRSISGAKFKFIWNPVDSSNASCAGAKLADFYPGDRYVDMVALDVYDGIGAATSSDRRRWTDMVNGVNAGGRTAVIPSAISGLLFKGYGLNWLEAFGEAHDKEIGLPEWGLDSSGTNAGGGDDSYYMTQMTNWIKTYATGPAIYWNYGDGTLQLNIPHYTSGGTPSATAVFKSAFSV